MKRNHTSSIYRGAFAVLLSVLLGAVVAHAQQDICGCANSPDSLGSFLAQDDTTWPPGTTRSRQKRRSSPSWAVRRIFRS